MREIQRMIEQTKADRQWFHDEARKTTPWNHGMLIDAAACAIRERALKDAYSAIIRDPMTAVAIRSVLRDNAEGRE